MKKSIFILSVVAAALFSSCGTTKVSGSGIKGNAAKVQKNYVTILDYQGASFGSEIQGMSRNSQETTEIILQNIFLQSCQELPAKNHLL